MGNVLLGVPFYFDDNLRSFYTGTLWGLLNPFALATGVLSVLMLTVHGALWLGLKSTGPVRVRAAAYAQWASLAVAILFIGLGVIVHQVLPGYVITSEIVTDGPSNPLLKTVALVDGGWTQNFITYPLMWIAPVAGVLVMLVARLSLRAQIDWLAFLGSKVSIIGIISTVGLTMFPMILPSSLDPNASLTAWDASSSELTLGIMLGATALFLPIILAYTAWVFKVLFGRVTAEYVEKNADSVY